MTPEKVVVDASAIATLLIDPGDAGEKVAARIIGAELHAPDHLPAEVTNVLRRRRNAGQLSETEARLAIDGFWMLPAQLWPFEVLAARAWELGANVSSYDAAYIALAERLRAPLVTGDRRLSHAPGPACAIELFG
ncbi:MAG: type II toxin-antitoxin system VapC family toxin [Microbacteriaceae bacterium]